MSSASGCRSASGHTIDSPLTPCAADFLLSSLVMGPRKMRPVPALVRVTEIIMGIESL